MSSAYSTFLIIEGEILEELQWTSYELAKKRFLELLDQYMNIQSAMVSIGCTKSELFSITIEYPGHSEHIFENDVVSQAKDQFSDFPEGLDLALKNTRRIWTWVPDVQSNMVWSTISVEDFLISCSSTTSAITEIET